MTVAMMVMTMYPFDWVGDHGNDDVKYNDDKDNDDCDDDDDGVGDGDDKDENSSLSI